MHIKIQGGGGGEYSNTGTSYGVVAYLRHEDKELLEQGRMTESFFSHSKDFVVPSEVVDLLDTNKAKLGRNDTKFFVLTISPSKEEILTMGISAEEQSRGFREYINTKVMEHYADGFGKNLRAEDLLYFGKIHHARGDKVDEQMHAHIIVSRKDKSDKIKLSPQTNHRNTKKGAIKGGFDRTDFFQNSETAFDEHFQYARDLKDTFGYKNTMKNGSVEERVAAEVAIHRENLMKEQKVLEKGKHLDKEMSKEMENKMKVVEHIVVDRLRGRGRGM